VADDPFFKSIRARYYPEVVVMNISGKVKARVNPTTRKYVRKDRDALVFEDDFRGPKLKINDDHRVQINLNALQPK
jgi:Tol biopolymer transport system component